MKLEDSVVDMLDKSTHFHENPDWIYRYTQRVVDEVERRLMAAEPIAEINIGAQEKSEFGYRIFSATLTSVGKELPGGRYLVYIKD